MMKNLKKVISAVAALALSVSSFVAFAQDFPDVASTANYSKAVDQLTSLGIVNGYEDGTFGPDKLVTRAEMTAMIVRALGADSQAQAAANTNTQFSDVTSNHWAAGYVTVGVNAKPMFIQGMGDGTFAPDANVTFAQATTMLVRAVGYESRANLVAWPTGYLSYGSQLNITNGVVGEVTNDTELNRGQVARLIDNAVVDAPLLVEDKLTTDVWGNPVWEYKQMNGKGDGWETLLINKHDAYKVYGTVTETSKQGGSLDADEVKFTITRADNFDDEYISTTTYPNGKQITPVNVGTTKAADNLNVYAEAIVAVDDEDNYTMVSFIPSGRTESVTYSTDDYAQNSKSQFGVAMAFYTDENQSRSTAYKLSTAAQGGAAKYYINGVEMTNFTAADLNTYVVNNQVGEVTLIDSKGLNAPSTPDGYYDSVMITYYADAVFKSLSNSVSKPRIYFDKFDNALTNAYLELDFDRTDATYTFKLGTPEQNEDISYEDLAANDILSIAWDVNGSLNNSDFVTVYVSRNTVDGTVMGTKVEDGVSKYTLGDTEYEANTNIVRSVIENGNDYTFYLDAFGKIAFVEEGVSSKLYGVIDYAWEADGGVYKVRLITNTGEKVDYELTKQTQAELDKVIGWATDDDGTAGDMSKLDSVQNRVVTYRLSASKGTITVEGPATAVSGSGADQLYRASTNRLGSIRLNDNTVCLDLIDYVDGDKDGVALMGGFTDDEYYEAYGFGKSSTDNTCSFVVVTEGIAGINPDSPLTVLASTSSITTEDGEKTLQLQVYSKGEAQYLMLDPDEYYNSTDYNDLVNDGFGIGSAFLYKADSEGYVTYIEPILNLDSSYTDLVNSILGSAAGSYADGMTDFNDIILKYGEDIAADGTDNTEYLVKGGSRQTKAHFAFGPVMETTGGISLGRLGADMKTDLRSLRDYSFDADTNVYAYDYDPSKLSQRVDISAEGAFVDTYVDTLAYEDDENVVNWNVGGNSIVRDNINFALLKIVDGDVTEAYAIIPPVND